MKRSFSFSSLPPTALVAAGTGLIAATYGLVRLAYGLHLPDVQQDLDLTDAAAGLISSGASAMYCLGALVGFLVASRRPLLLVAVAGVSAAGGSLCAALATTVGWFAVSTVLASAGAGLASPALVAVLQRRLPGPRGDRAQTLVNAGTGPGLVLAGLFALLLAPDWRTAWVLAAVGTLLAASLVLLIGRGGDQAPVARALPPASWVGDHRTVLVAALLLWVGSAAVWTYGRSLLAAGSGGAGSVVGWIALGIGGVAVIAAARWTAALRPPVAWAVTSAAVAASSAALVPAAARLPLALVVCVVFGWGYTAATGALIAWTTSIDPARAPTGTAVLFVTLVLGQAAGAALAGAGADLLGLPATFLLAAAVAAVAALLGLRRAARVRPAPAPHLVAAAPQAPRAPRG